MYIEWLVEIFKFICDVSYVKWATIVNNRQAGSSCISKIILFLSIVMEFRIQILFSKFSKILMYYSSVDFGWSVNRVKHLILGLKNLCILNSYFGGGLQPRNSHPSVSPCNDRRPSIIVWPVTALEDACHKRHCGAWNSWCDRGE